MKERWISSRKGAKLKQDAKKNFAVLLLGVFARNKIFCCCGGEL